MDEKFKEIESKVKELLGIKKLPNFEIKINESLDKRIAYNKKVGDKYVVALNSNNLNGLKHELIHLALKQFSYSNLKINLPVPKKYEKDDKTVRFMEYLTIVFEIKMGDPEKIEENLNNYEKYGFSMIKEFHQIFSKINFVRLDQKFIDELIIKNQNENHL